MKMIRIKTLVILLYIAFLSSCNKENACDCIKRTGKIETQKRWVNNFDKIYVETDVNVIITQDSTFDVEVEAGKNIGWLIATDVVDGTLNIKNKNRCNWARSYKEPLNVYVKMPVISYITSNGSGNISSANTITTPQFQVQIESSGNIQLSVNNSLIVSHIFGYGDLTLNGTTHEHDADIGGCSFLDCRNLNTSITYIHSFTTGLSYVDATNLLTCKIDLDGDVYCYGNPVTVQKTITNSGQLYLK